MKSLQLVCINYGNFEDAVKVLEHCVRVFDRFEKITLFHPQPKDWFSDILTGSRFVVFHAQSKTQNECCLHEMPQSIICDHALGIQWDGFIVNPDAWTDKFLEYDLIAPPWPLENLPNPEWRVGSGGFCLFSKRFAQAWGKICKPHPAPNTDWSYGALERDKFEALGMKFAPLELAMRFGEEIPLDDQPKLGYTPFGFHGKQYDSENRRKYFEILYGKGH